MPPKPYIARTQARIRAIIQDLESLSKQVEEERTHYTLGTIEAWVAAMKGGLKYLLHINRSATERSRRD
jgi:hypothetical protein